MSSNWRLFDPVEDSQVPVEDSQVQDSQLQDSEDAMEPVEVRLEKKKRPQPNPNAEYSGPCKWKVGIPNLPNLKKGKGKELRILPREMLHYLHLCVLLSDLHLNQSGWRAQAHPFCAAHPPSPSITCAP